MTHPNDSTLYANHVATLCANYDRILIEADVRSAIVTAGQLRYQFLDDRDYDFAANPHFKHWLPLTAHPKCAVIYTQGARPALLYFQEADYWHLPPSDPDGVWVGAFDIHVCRDDDELKATAAKLADDAIVIGESRDAEFFNGAEAAAKEVFDQLHEARTIKTEYELACMRAAQQMACHGHIAAANAFADGCSEYDIHAAYLDAMRQRENELPYNSIVALNEHAAVLHYQYLDRDAPDEHRAFLIDAGASYAGYAADITRTYGNGDADFGGLLDAMETLQLAMCDDVRAGIDYRSLHLGCHERLANVLLDTGIAKSGVSAEQLVDDRVTWAMFPHGLGHFLGLQVHDVGGLSKASAKELIAKPEGHEALRLTRTLAADEVLTIEPGCYFIPLLLEPLRADSETAALLNWPLIDKLTPFGGIRIEDDVRVLDGGRENLTRNAFNGLGC
ncbi:MAG: Xaa-Pro dipeptidase [Pseudomonadota bacterium]